MVRSRASVLVGRFRLGLGCVGWRALSWTWDGLCVDLMADLSYWSELAWLLGLGMPGSMSNYPQSRKPSQEILGRVGMAL